LRLRPGASETEKDEVKEVREERLRPREEATEDIFSNTYGRS
jgi:hypothetical protein